ncbi:MAG TPA: bacteriohopanetetrol glucosamine biosynthesis glycosyltransferase HpnI [Stellaceae bacterium]|nr:bacteriohopanetetrol glucosamine biosynthesis glycosyltransferase HpnI [Stellaceae bacterium]
MNPLGIALVLFPLWLYLVGAIAAALGFAHRRARATDLRPAVSVLKPLHGDEPGLHDNLLSFVDQQYPAVQIVFGVRSAADRAVPIARAVIAERPGADAALVIDTGARGSNLKVANLENILPAARHDILVFADSDMRVGRDYLAAVVAPFEDERTGLVTCLYKGVSSGGLWSRLGTLHINYGFLPSALVGDAMGVGGGCFGATIALRREMLDRIGGFAPLRDELADDHRIGGAVRATGAAVVLAPYLVENRVAEPSFGALWRHELRWARTVRAMTPLGYAGSIITHPVPVAALLAVLSGFSAWGCGFLLATFVLRGVVAAAVARALKLSTEGLWLLPLRDALSFAVFMGSFCGRSVAWRDQLFRVDAGGRMSADGDRLG